MLLVLEFYAAPGTHVLCYVPVSLCAAFTFIRRFSLPVTKWD